MNIHDITIGYLISSVFSLFLYETLVDSITWVLTINLLAGLIIAIFSVFFLKDKENLS